MLRKPVCSTDQPKLHRQDCASLLGPYTQGKVEVQQGSPLILMESWSGVVGCWTAQEAMALLHNGDGQYFSSDKLRSQVDSDGDTQAYVHRGLLPAPSVLSHQQWRIH